MDEISWAIDHALDVSRTRLQWYIITEDEKYIRECKEWHDIASIYMNQLIKENTNEKTVEV